MPLALSERPKSKEENLFFLTGFGKYSELKKLVEKKIDINCQQDESGNTALHIAIFMCNPSRPEFYNIIELLLANNADPYLKNKKGKTPFDCHKLKCEKIGIYFDWQILEIFTNYGYCLEYINDIFKPILS